VGAQPLFASAVTVPATPSRPPVVTGAAAPAASPTWTVPDAEALLLSLPGIVSAHVHRDEAGVVREVHLLASSELGAKQIVRNVESAMLARFGARVDHRAISVAQTSTTRPSAEDVAEPPAAPVASAPVEVVLPGRGIYFEDVEVRRSRSLGIGCTVTLRAGAQALIGEAAGPESARTRGELAARATVSALAPLLAPGITLAFEACTQLTVAERDFAFVVVSGRSGRESTVLSGSCEVRDGLETAAVLAVLDATERWLERGGR
jgi:hypothetical protein